MSFDLTGKKIWVAGHRGMVGRAIVRQLETENCTILSVDRNDLDLTRQADVEAWMGKHRPDAVIIAAAKVGGIQANAAYPVDFLYSNLMIEANIVEGAHKTGVKKLLLLGSSCSYPRLAEQPISEDALLTGPLEPTNEWNAIAKIAGLKLTQAYRQQYNSDFIAAMPAASYGIGDNFDPENCHVIPGLMRRMHEAKENQATSIEIWGSGKPRREFIFVDDMADALIFLLKTYSEKHPINIGIGSDVTIKDLAHKIAGVVDYKGKLVFNTDKPDGMPRKLLDSSRLTSMGWTPKVVLEEGLLQSYNWFLNKS